MAYDHAAYMRKRYRDDAEHRERHKAKVKVTKQRLRREVNRLIAAASVIL